MKKIFLIFWFIIGFIQFTAIVSGFINTFGIFGIPIALILAEIPIVGTIVGINGAITNWGWSIESALLLFLGLPVGSIIIPSIKSIISEKISNFKIKNKKLLDNIAIRAHLDAKSIIKSNLFFINKYDANPHTLGSRKEIFSYFQDFFYLYIKMFESSFVLNKNSSILGEIEYIGKYLYSHQKEIPYNTEFNAKAIIRDFYLNSMKIIYLRYKEDDIKKLEKNFEIAEYLITFRHIGWERDEYICGTNNDKQKELIRKLIIDSREYISTH